MHVIFNDDLVNILKEFSKEDIAEFKTEIQNLVAWQTNPTISLQKVANPVFFEFLMLGALFHEYWHPLALHMPLNKIADHPDFSIARWVQISNTPELLASAVNLKNLVKAVLDSRNWLARKRKAVIHQIKHLENQCDRASIFFFDSFFKILAMQKALRLPLGENMAIMNNETIKINKLMYEIDDARKANKLKELFAQDKFEKLFEQKNITDIDRVIAQITQEFQQAETQHPYLSGPHGEGFKNPELTSAEREYFREAIRYLQWFDSLSQEGELGVFRGSHIQESPWMQIALDLYNRRFRIGVARERRFLAPVPALVTALATEASPVSVPSSAGVAVDLLPAPALAAASLQELLL